MPRLPPVTSATRPARSSMGHLLRSVLRPAQQTRQPCRGAERRFAGRCRQRADAGQAVAAEGLAHAFDQPMAGLRLARLGEAAALAEPAPVPGDSLLEAIDTVAA